MMTDREIKGLVAAADDSLLLPQTLPKVERRQYGFLPRYLHSADSDVRNTALGLLVYVNQPWCLPLLFQTLRDPVASHRAIAADALRKLVRPEDRQTLYDEIAFQDRTYLREEDRITGSLILALGVVGGADDIPALEKLQVAASSPSALTACQMALARCGQTEAVDAIKADLQRGDASQRSAALDKAGYTGAPQWIPIVAPLLADERVYSSFELGPRTIKRRVCDAALSALMRIDTAKAFEFSSVPYRCYTQEQLAHARGTYGIRTSSD